MMMQRDRSVGARNVEGIEIEGGDKKPLRSSPEIGDGALYN
jgi:hypothetical protein